MKPEDLLDQVCDRDSFIRFVRALAEERDQAEKIERSQPKTYIIDGACDWKNGDVASFLYGSLDYFSQKPFHTPENEPSWKMFADFLYHGKIIE
jgi:hypothetical protein